MATEGEARVEFQVRAKGESVMIQNRNGVDGKDRRIGRSGGRDDGSRKGEVLDNSKEK